MAGSDLSSVTARPITPSVCIMVELLKISDQVLLQLISDALASRAIRFRVDNAGMHALMPLPGVMDARILVDEDDLTAAELILKDLEIQR